MLIDNYRVNKASTLHMSDYARPEMALILLSKPKVICCVLPGGLNYLEVRSPGRKTPHNYVQSLGYNVSYENTFMDKIYINVMKLNTIFACLNTLISGTSGRIKEIIFAFHNLVL